MNTTTPDHTDSRYRLSRITSCDYEGGKAYEIKTYDDGMGKLYVLRDSLGITGVVRAQSWETAYEIKRGKLSPRI